VKHFYLSELRRLGWAFAKESEIKDWGRDFGGRELNFTNGDYYLSIQYAGEKADYDWNYTTAIGWRQ
jgi:hypothetical protein